MLKLESLLIIITIININKENGRLFERKNNSY